ncbi:MAG TPA: response regulator transcription factor [Terriglobales bacterium]
MSPSRILVADDHDVIRQGVISLIKDHLGWEVCGEACDGRDAVDKAKELKPDIVIIDIGMPLLNGLDATRQILKENPIVRVLVLTMADGDRAVRDAFEAGAQGFVLKSDASRDLVAAIDALGHGNTFFTARVSRIVLSGYLEHVQRTKNEQIAPTLTPREREVIQLVAEGESSKQVAARLGISPKTAETHRNNVMQKLNLHSMVELVLFAVRNGIIQVAMSGSDSRSAAQRSQSSAA